MDKAQLKPCPFCGGQDVHHLTPDGADGDRVYDSVICNTCGATCNNIDTQPELDCLVAWNRRPQPPSASGEREAFEDYGHSKRMAMRRHPHLASAYDNAWVDVAWEAWQARAALAPSPGIDAAEHKPVAWLIDWPDEPELGHCFAEEPSPTARSRALVLADAAPPAARPSADDPQFPFYELRFIMRVLSHQGSAPKEDWQTAYGMARDIFVRWSKERQAAEPHPPSRACMCDACKPSFDNGADDPAQRYDTARQVPGPSAEWLAEAVRLVDAYANEFAQGGATYARDIRRASLLAHLRSPHAAT